MENFEKESLMIKVADLRRDAVGVDNLLQEIDIDCHVITQVSNDVLHLVVQLETLVRQKVGM